VNAQNCPVKTFHTFSRSANFKILHFDSRIFAKAFHKNKAIMKALFFFTVLLFTKGVFSQIMPLTTEPDGGNKKASVSEQIGVVKININYSRPGVKGREGKIWGTNVAHYGFRDQGHGTSYAAPWRAGANENTTMSFSHSLKIEGNCTG
jgi:Protein of unknown function (DUF2911)